MNNYSPLQPQRNRRSIRLRGYDYSRAGAYFVTICVQNRECLFGDVVDGKMILNDAGQMVETVWMKLAIRFGYIELDEFMVMPNHFHGIFVLSGRGESCIRPEMGVRPEMGDHNGRSQGSPLRICPETGDHKDRPYGTLPGTVGRVIQAFKSTSTHEYINGVKQNNWTPFPGKLWQRNYYEHIIRNDDELNRIREYIVNNPAKWDMDRENPNTLRARHAGPNRDSNE